ncbi:MAG: hypothetical protein ACON38_09990 [Akkermansiaceae bacterium]
MKKAPLMIAVWAVAVVPAFSLPIPDAHTQRTVAFEGKHKKVILEVTGIR